MCKTCKGLGFLRIDVPVGHPDFGKVAPCPDCHADLMREHHQSRVTSNPLEGEMKDWTFDNYVTGYGDETAYQAALDFVTSPSYWLTFYGGYGRGKSHLLAAIHKALTLRGVACCYTTMPDLTSEMRASVRRQGVEDFYNRISHYPVLLIDEVDKADLKSWTREQTFRLFNRRANLKQVTGTVMAMNMAPDTSDETLGYLFSRMNDDRSKVIKLAGEDNRNNISLLRQLGGILR